jgi:hypothetical protein
MIRGRLLRVMANTVVLLHFASSILATKMRRSKLSAAESRS